MLKLSSSNTSYLTRIWSWSRYGLVALLLLAHCSGGTGPAPNAPGDGVEGGDGTIPAAPAPPAEIPSFFRFPKDVSIDVSTVSPAQTLLAQVPPNGEFSDAITLGEKFLGVNDLLDEMLTELNGLEIPVSPTVTTFAGTATEDGRFFKGNDVKIDFADFDFAGTGSTLGCTGNTCPVETTTGTCPTEALLDELKPVCLRLWVDEDGTGNFVRTLAGYFTRLPIEDNPNTIADETNPGAAELIVEPIVNLVAGPHRLAFKLLFDHQSPLTPLNESLDYTQVLEIFDPTTLETAISNSTHIKVDQVGLPTATTLDEVEKTLQFSFEVLSNDPADPPAFGQYLSRWRENAIFWSGSAEIEGSEFGPIGADFSYRDVCALLNTGNGTDRNNCLDLGINVGNEGFLALPQASDVQLPNPNAFPEEPTF